MRNKIAFGTDGIRGKFGQYPLDTASINNIALTIAAFVPNGQIAIARDTRASGIAIQQQLSQVLIQHGCHVFDCGVLPTAALACIVVDDKLDLGIVITASHNPAEDNGIKLFNRFGQKLSKAEQQDFQDCFLKVPLQSLGLSIQHENPSFAWKRRLPKTNLSGMRILVDCAHGSLSPYAKEILEERGAIVTERASSPDGTNINDNVGALHPPSNLDGFDLALCFDGDADRLLITTEQQELDGDDFLWLLQDQIKGPIVGTVMSNGGLDEALQHRLIRSAVGDQNVLQCMQENNSVIGAEPSGHILFLDGDMPSGDGMYAALRILQTTKSPIIVDWKRWPVSESSIRFDEKQFPDQVKPELSNWSSIKFAEASGHRLVVRYSGTESKLRILVEGADAEMHRKAIESEFYAKMKH